MRNVVYDVLFEVSHSYHKNRKGKNRKKKLRSLISSVKLKG